MFLPFFKSRPVLRLILAITLTTGWLHAAPYGPDGMEIEWTQPDGTKLSLRVFGDEFYARTETPDGYTVVYHPADKAYHYARLSNDGLKLIPSGRRVNGKAPAGLAKHLETSPEARRIVWKERYEKLAPNERANWSKRVKAARQRKGLDADEPAPEPAAGDGATGTASSAAFAPVTGSYVGLTILVQFPDDPATGTSDPTSFPTTKVAMENYCNQIGYTGGGNSGSVRDYFLAQSLNQTDYTQVVTEIVTLPQPRAYYNWSDYPTNATLRDGGLTGRLVLNDAITILKAQGFDFTGLTRDGSNRVVATNVLFAGATSGVWPDGLWPHRWSLSPQVNVGTTPNPIYIYDYQITNAQTASVPIGTFCHENGHLLLKYPDLYDYGGESRGVGNHCLMGGGNYNNNGKTPSPINGYFKDVSGWSNVVDITTSQFFTDALPTTNNEGYRIRKPGTSTEYFLIENRGTGDPWAQYSADKGIMIWHIDETVNGNDNEQMTASQHYEVSVEQADGAFDLEYNRDGGDTADAFDSTYPNFTDTTTPNAKWWNGSNSGIQIAVLSAAGASMNVRFGLPANTISVLAPNGGEQIYFGSNQTITWGANITGNVKIELFKGGILHTELSANETNDGSYSWLVSSGLPTGNDYTVKISSVDTPAYVDSSDAAFTIMAQPTLADALETTGLTWTNSGNANWFAQSTTTHDGIDAAQSGAIGHSQNSYVETTVTGPGTLTFWWKVSSETNYDYLRFYLDGAEQTGSLAKISGVVDWTQKTVSIPAGIHTVKWGYTKDGSVVSNADAAWVDQFVYTPSAAPEIVVEEPVGTNLIDGSASIDCGVFNLSSSSAPIAFTVKNTGAADLTGLALSKDGANSGDFTLGSLGATTLAPGASTTFTVTFSPGAIGARSAAVHIASNDSDENPFDIALTGTGVTVGTLVVSPAGNLTSSGSYGGLFSPSSQLYTLSNPGTTSIDWTAAKTAGWVDLSATGGTLGAGDVATMTVSINGNANSLALGGYNDTVTFTNTTNSNGDTTRGVALTVNPIPATVTLGNLSQTYDGSSKSASVTTNPPDLDYTITYDGSATPPTSAGTYAVVATITEPNYTGGDSKDLIIAKASQTINFAALSPAYDNAAPFALTSTASSGLTVSFASSNSAVATVSGDTVTVVGLGTTTITASQAGNTNYSAATSVPQTLSVVRFNPLAVTGGPYSVLVGQSVTLNGGASEPSYNETITAWEWDLNNDNSFGDVTGASPVISYSTLISAWGRVPGPNTIQLKVTDSSGKTSTASTTLTLIATVTWDANGATANQTDGAGAWLTANQWWTGSANTTWSSTANAIFGNGGAGGAVTLASPTTVNSITFNSFTGTYTLGSAVNTITLNGGITNNSATGTVSIISPLALGGTQTWTNNSSNALTVSGGLLMDSNTLTIAGSGTTSWGTSGATYGGVGATGGLIKSGNGRFQMGGAATVPTVNYTGQTQILGGVLMASSNMPGGNLLINGGVWEEYWSYTMIRTLGSGAGEVQITGGVSGFSENGAAGLTVTLNNNAAFEAVWGSSFFNPTTLVLQSTSAQTGSTLTFSNKLDLNGADRTIQVNQTSGSVRATISGQIRNSTGTAGLTKTGAGRLLFTNAANAWNGNTIINGGLLDLGGMTNANLGGGSGRNVTVAAGAAVRFAALSNTFLNRIVQSSDEITVMTGATANNLDFSSSTGANLPNAFLGNYATNGAKMEYSGTLTPASDNYRLGGKYSDGLLAMVGTNKLTGARGLIVGGTGASSIRVMLAGDNDFTGDTVINTGAKLTLGNNLALQNSALDVGAAGGNFALNSAGTVTNATVAASPTFGGLKGSRALLSVLTNAGGNNESNLAATAVTGFTLNPGTGKTCTYTGVIADFATGTTLTKTGPGTQIFSTANTYTGATSVNQGILLVNNSTGSGTGTNTVTVNGGTLGGSGTISGSVTVAAAGNLSPGNASAGTLNIGGGLNLSAMAAGSGVINHELNTLAGTNDRIAVTGTLSIGTGALGFNNFAFINLGGLQVGNYTLITSGGISGTLDPANLSGTVGALVGTLSIAGNNLVLNIAVPDTTPPALTGITDDKSGGLIPANTLVTYTVTFNEDMDASTVAADDFGNAGTTAVTIGSIIESSPGVFTVQATPTSGGTLQLKINAGAVLKDVAGNNLNTAAAIPDDTIISVDGIVPAVVGITDDKSGNPVAVGTLVTYTVTFSEDMDAVTVTSADFGNAGTATVTIGSVTETLPGIFNVQATPTTAGTLLLRINQSAVLKDLAGNNLNTGSAIADDTTLTVDGTPPTLASITDDKSGSPVAINDLVTYTVTFSEDMDAGTVASGDFGNEGSAAITIGTITETLPGIFTVQATPTTAGTLQLRINQSAELKDVVGNNLNTASAIVDETIITVDGTVPTLASITDDKSGGPVAVNTLVTYTVSFSEDMDASTFTSGDLGNAGTATFTIGTVTETLPGVFTVEVTPTAEGTLQLQVNAAAVIKDIAGNSVDTTSAIIDETVITVDGTVPTLASFTDDKGGNPVTENTLVTYTVTFSEDMDASTVTAADFDNAGTANVSIGSVSEISPDVFTVEATPTAEGTLQLVVNAGAVLKDVAGNSVNTATAIADETVITVDGTVPTLASITDDKTGGPVAVNSLVTYTVTFSEDMDASTVTVDDFGNAGSAAITIDSVSESSSGIFTVQATPTSAGTLQLQVNVAAVLNDVAGNNLLTSSAIADDTIITVDGTMPTLASIDDDKSGGPVAVNSLVTYTVTFSEDMDASTVTAGDFGNAGTATVSMGFVAEISPGVFTVEATPTAEGTLQLVVNAGAVLKDVAGNNLDTTSAIADETIITVDGTAPMLASITDDKSGGPIDINTLVTYTVSFGEDMDAGTVTADDFGNSGSAAVTIGLVSESSSGIFTVQATPTSAGTLQLQVNADAVLKDVAGNNLLTTSAIADDTIITVDGTAPMLISITDDKSGGPVAMNTLVTYTVTFSEDMDESTVTDTDFSNAGTAAVTINSVTETAPTSGVFTVQATPTSAGTLQLQVNAAAVLKDMAGTNLDTTSAIADETIITVDGTVPTLASITDDKSGGPLAVNTLVTYTVTFSEDMDAGTVTADDFGNAGTAAVSIGSVAEISPGVFTVEVTPTAEGTLQLQVNAAAVIKDIAGNSVDTTSAIVDETVITIDGTAPTVASITDDKSGGPVDINAMVTYTVTFSEDMNDSTVSAADFGNAGTAAVTIGSVSESSPGVFTVQATPTSAGTLQLQVNASAVLKDMAGNNLDTVSAIADDTVLTVLSPYGSWANGTFAHAFTSKEPGDDQDKDSMINLMEYAFGTDPTVSSSGPVVYSGGAVTAHGKPLLIEQGGTRYAVFGRRVDHAAAGLTYTVRFSADLEPGYWNTSPAVPTVLATDGVIEVVEIPYPGPVATSSGPKTARFFSIGVSSN